jgi:hypothetical protein
MPVTRRAELRRLAAAADTVPEKWREWAATGDYDPGSVMAVLVAALDPTTVTLLLDIADAAERLQWDAAHSYPATQIAKDQLDLRDALDALEETK